MKTEREIQGTSFEHWVRDTLKPYTPKIQMSKANEHYDLSLSHNSIHYLLECKCYSYLKGREQHMNSLIINQAQLEHLKNRRRTVYGANQIRFIIGILFTRYDMYPVTMAFDSVYEMGTYDQHRKRRIIPMSRIIRQYSLRQWIGRTFDVEPETVKYPQFRIPGESLND